MQFVPVRSIRARTFAWLLLGVVVVAVISACIREEDLTPEQRAYTLDRELMCPVCDGQTIDESHAQIAEDMKVIVREKIAGGESNQDIRDYFVARYGEVVLASPEASGFNLIVWLMPIVIAGGGALAVVWVLKNMRRTSETGTGDAPNLTLEQRQLQKYLDRVDAEIGRSGAEPQQDDSQQAREGGNV